jgi:adenylate cyclase class 2
MRPGGRIEFFPKKLKNDKLILFKIYYIKKYMMEVELKFQIVDFQNLLKKIEKEKFKMTMPETHELSIMYDNGEGLMHKTDGRIRVRKSGDKIEFCYKKPITREGVKKEIEYEVVVSDFDNLTKIISEMGFASTTSYERYRTEFFKEKIKITLDRYPFANFIEIEGNEDDIWEVAKKLDLKKENNLTQSCDTLFTKWRESKSLKPIAHMKFENFDK